MLPRPYSCLDIRLSRDFRHSARDEGLPACACTARGRSGDLLPLPTAGCAADGLIAHPVTAVLSQGRLESTYEWICRAYGEQDTRALCPPLTP